MCSKFDQFWWLKNIIFSGGIGLTEKYTTVAIIMPISPTIALKV